MTFLCCAKTFAQPPKIDLDQLRNGGNAGPPPGSATSWVNGNLGSSNSHYREGYSVPYRVRINNIPTGVTITVRLAYDIKHSGRNALDYLTYYRRNQPHTGWTPEHLEEAVDPLDGATGTYGAPSYSPIPCPTVNAVYTPPTPLPQPSTSCNTLPNVVNPPGLPAGRQHDMTIFNGTIDSIRYVYEGDLNASQSEAAIKVSFRATSSDVVIAWGGHIGSRIDWGYDADGVPRSAGGISGSPYHMRILSWGVNGTGVQDGSLPNLGNTDRSLSADAVARPPECLDLDFTTNATNPLCPGTVNNYGVVINPLACTQPSYQWLIPPSTNNSGAFIVGSNTGQNIQINSGTHCGGFTVQVTVICTEGMITCDTTINVIDLVPPTLTINNHNPSAGCNPQTIPFGTPSATDNCNAAVTITSSTGSITSSGCSRSQTRTWTAFDACGNSATESRTVTWIEDTEGPAISVTGHNPNGGCNPTSIPFGTASATDNCGAATVTSSTGSITSSGCNRSQTRFWTATDACQNSSSTSRTVSWVEDTTPPVITIADHNPNAGCNPTSLPFGTASATDNCGAATVTSSTGSVTSDGCNRSQTRFWTATDACQNSSSTSRTVSWVEDTTPPVITIAGHNPNAGCNPTSIPFGTASATDNCGAATVTSSTGSVTSDGCNRSQTRFWTATDVCQNSSSTSRTVSWVEDTTPPVITIAGYVANAGCNPTVLAFGTASATDNCGAATVTSSTGSVSSDGCNRSQTRFWTATDACNNSSSTSRTVSWVEDVTPPVITIAGHVPNAGCNPTVLAFGTASATDNCGAATVTSSTGSITSSGCNRSQTRFWTATDACNNSSSTSRTVSWVEDVTPPVITIAGHVPNAGCNPTSLAFGTASATDNCGAATVTSSTGSVTSSGCNRSQTRFWTATDACNNSSSTSRTVSWVEDVTPPVITIAGHVPNAGCNPSSLAFGTASATDNCGAASVTSSTGSVTSSGCNRSQTRFWTATDACNNSSSTSRTVSWVEDTQAPVFTDPPQNVDLACDAAVPTVPTVTATDNCGAATVELIGSTDNPANCSTGFNRIITRTWKATDACGNSTTHTQTIRFRCCDLLCTYTQGYYGNPGGTSCDGTNGGLSTAQLIGQSLHNWGDTLTVGMTGKSVGIKNNAANIACLIAKLPGGGPAKELPSGNYNICNLPSSIAPAGGRIKNVLLAQTLTLALNVGITSPSQLGAFPLRAGELATAEPIGGCGSKDPKIRECIYNTEAPYNLINVVNEYTYRTFSQALIDAIPGTKNVGNLLVLANRALANADGVVGSENGVSLSEIAGAAGSINEVFDECRVYVGWDVERCAQIDPNAPTSSVAKTANELSVSAFPNPYEDQNFSLRINAPVSGEATIQFFTIDGQQITQMKRTIVANKAEVVNFRVPGLQKSKIAYVVTIGKYNSKGIVLSPN
jgi:hypothetical protein